MRIVALLPTDGHLNFKYLRPGDLRRLEQVHVMRRLTEGAFARYYDDPTGQTSSSAIIAVSARRRCWTYRLKVFGRSDKLFIRLLNICRVDGAAAVDARPRWLIAASIPRTFRSSQVRSGLPVGGGHRLLGDSTIVSAGDRSTGSARICRHKVQPVG